ncbi:PREDICTED: TBC1 domain family member 1-like isoform X2 [Amphimedon queenslandica]|uniref:Rab-GAP TBC domain-containing protein n=1 Tax=Amphimedon queenslandica TaxID=400682 RepID=A0A1X7UDM2_AMPQE|nr:PREDICTED: TBC1 domain family member 1-like isoform X2 [Amphimedon queenslandica]|eukprot:XP_019854945.1 PREDICTED: TBC1 domain family member 1-like isoform X2 [Amphimedon queenslandica]
MSESQSLFQVYYLGCLEVDRRFSSSVLPWITEQLKLELEDMKLVWVTLGPSSIGYVADSGEHITSHQYKSIIRWSPGLEGVSFAYITTHDKDNKTYCHAFQCLDLNEAKVIVQLFNEYCLSFDVSSEAPFMLSGDKLANLIHQNKKKTSKSRGGGAVARPVDQFNVIYCGSMKAKIRTPINAKLVDGFVSCLSKREKPTSAKKYKKWRQTRKRGSVIPTATKAAPVNSMFRTGSVSDEGSSDVHVHVQPDPGTEEQRVRSTSEVTNSSIEGECTNNDDNNGGGGGGGWDVSKKEQGTLVKDEDRHEATTEGESVRPAPATRVEVLDSSTEVDEEFDDTDYILIDNDEDFYDVPPDVFDLQSEPGFSTMSVDDVIKCVRENLSNNIETTLYLSGSTCEMKQESDSLIFSYNTKRVLGCAQGLQFSDYVGFVTREKGSSDITFHLMSSKAAAAVIKSFKSSFDEYVSQSLPFTLCHSCPINTFNNICQQINGSELSTRSMYRLLEVYLNESEISGLDCPSDPFENDHTQLVRWVMRLSKYFKKKQAQHNHQEKREKEKKRNVGKKAMKLLHLKSMTGSYDNLRINEQSKHHQYDALHSSSATSVLQGTGSGYTSSQQSSPTSNHDVGWSREVSPDHKRKSGVTSEATPSSNKRAQLLVTGNNNRLRTDSGAPSTIDRPVSPLAGDSGHVSPSFQSPSRKGHKRSMSWRQQIFESVTPNKTDSRKSSLREVLELDLSHKPPVGAPVAAGPQRESTDEVDGPSGASATARRRWEWAIQQQLLLIRLDKANQSVLMETLTRQKLSYAELALDTNVMTSVWNKILENTNEINNEELLASIKMGIPAKLRERVWRLLIVRYKSSSSVAASSGYTRLINNDQFIDLYSQHTEYESLINADLDRTYPKYQYFSKQVKHGRMSLCNVLKAYSVADREIGYCQGLSFVTGLFLLHSSSDVDGFNMLSDFMHIYGYRDIYSSDMYQLQIKLYQFSRLVHDSLPALHVHLEDHDVTPFLYAAPWFLTLFSSQFPLNFVARLMDLILFEGVVAIFKVGLAILTHYEEEIKQLNGMESITDFIKVSIPHSVEDSVSEILHTAVQIPAQSLAIKLQTFETEYHVMHEIMATFHMKESSSSVSDTNELLRKQNKDLIEQLAVCRGAILRLESMVTSLNERVEEQEKRIEKLEVKRIEEDNENVELFYSAIDINKK